MNMDVKGQFISNIKAVEYFIEGEQIDRKTLVEDKIKFVKKIKYERKQEIKV